MKPFDENATCPKCGGDNVGTLYQRARVIGGCWWECPEGEHLHRYCSRCQYGWPEACISPQEEPVPEQVCAVCLGKGMVRILDDKGRHIGVKVCPGCGKGEQGWPR